MKPTTLAMLAVLGWAASGAAQTNPWPSFRLIKDLNLATPRADDEFGRALAAGDFDGDGFADLAIGILRHEDELGRRAGGVQVVYGGPFFVDGSRTELWTQARDGRSRKAADLDLYGYALSSGDFDGDGLDDLAVGIPSSDASGTEDAGAVEVLYGSRAGLENSGAQLWLPGHSGLLGSPSPSEAFGAALAAGDFDADGLDDLAVGIPMRNAGAVQVLLGTSTGLTGSGNELWYETSTSRYGRLTASGERGDGYGATLAVGDFDSDGFEDLAVGVPYKDPPSADGLEDYGAVQILEGGTYGLTWSPLRAPQFPYLLESYAALGVDEGTFQGFLQDWFPVFGYALAGGDFDGDGVDDLAVGAPGANLMTWPYGLLYTVGGALVFGGHPDGLSESPDEIFVGSSQYGGHGYLMAVGNFDGDSQADLAIAGSAEVELRLGQYRGRYLALTESAEAMAAVDLNGDGLDELVLGFPRSTLSGVRIGAVRVFVPH